MDAVTPLKIAIVSAGVSQRDLAERVGLSETHLSKIVNGRHRPSYETRVALAKAVGSDAAVLWPADDDLPSAA